MIGVPAKKTVSAASWGKLIAELNGGEILVHPTTVARRDPRLHYASG